MSDSVSVAVVGGGLSGLVAAFRLRRLLGTDARIVVAEASDRLGGKLRDGRVGGVRVEVGAEAFVTRRPEASALLMELGMAGRVVAPTGVRPALLTGGALRQLPAPTLMGVPADPAVLAGVADPGDLERMRGEAMRPVEWSPRSDRSVGGFVAERFGPSVVARSVDPMLGGVYAARAHDIGMRAALPALARRLDAGDSLTAAVTGLLPEPTGAPVFGAVAGGYRVLVERLAAASGADVRLRTPVAGVEPIGRRWRVDGVGDVDGVVLALPADALARVWPAGDLGIAQADSLLVVLALPPAATLPGHSGVLVASDEPGLEAKAFTFVSAKWGAPPGLPTIVRASYGRLGDDAPVADPIASASADLAMLCAAAGLPTPEIRDVLVQRWDGGLPQYGPGHAARVAAVEARRPPGLVLAGAAFDGVGVPACIGRADRAARRLAVELGDR